MRKRGVRDNSDAKGGHRAKQARVLTYRKRADAENVFDELGCVL